MKKVIGVVEKLFTKKTKTGKDVNWATVGGIEVNCGFGQYPFEKDEYATVVVEEKYGQWQMVKNNAYSGDVFALETVDSAPVKKAPSSGKGGDKGGFLLLNTLLLSAVRTR